MNSIPNDLNENFVTLFPEGERDILLNNHLIQEEIRSFLCSRNKEFLDFFIEDGFFPYYTQQKDKSGNNLKILFIMKECYGREGQKNYIEELLKEFKSGFAHKIFQLCIKICYGLKNNLIEFPEFSEIKNTVLPTFGSESGLSFAFINISKLRNTSGYSIENVKQINEYIYLTNYQSGINYHFKQIDNINPTLIIGGNICQDIKFLKENGLCTFQGCSKWNIHFDCNGNETNDEKWPCLQVLKTENNRFWFIDCYHFSAYKKQLEDFYIPIKAAYNFILNNPNKLWEVD